MKPRNSKLFHDTAWLPLICCKNWRWQWLAYKFFRGPKSPNQQLVCHPHSFDLLPGWDDRQRNWSKRWAHI
jgi:hypothetical protein